MYGKFLSIGSAVQRAQMTTDCLHPEAAQICVSHKSPFYRCDWPISGLISGRAARGNSARQRQRQRPRFFFSAPMLLGRVNWPSAYRVPRCDAMLKGETIAGSSAVGRCHPILDTAWTEPTVVRARVNAMCDAVAATRGCNSLLLVEGLHHFRIKCSTYHGILSHTLPSYCLLAVPC
jgi:hypothetical protein